MGELISFETQIVVVSLNHSALSRKAFHISPAGANTPGHFQTFSIDSAM